MKIFDNKISLSNLLTRLKFPIFILFISLLMGVGYASINSITLDFNGFAIAKEVDGVYIVEAKYLSSVDANLSNSKINNAYQTNLDSYVSLSTINASSSITYSIIVYNSSDVDYRYVEPLYVVGSDTYSNESITFTINGINRDDIIKSKESKSFQITFYYINNILAYNNNLKSIINFNFEPFVQLESAGTLINIGNESSGVFGSTLSKDYIEKISLVNHKNIPEGVDIWDASVEGNNSITGWSTDTDQDGMSEIYLGTASGKITLPEDSSYIFSGYGNVEEIDFSNVDTSKVVNMSSMFSNSLGLKSLDLSKFDTSNVTNMSNMFYSLTGLTELDLSKFNTVNVTNMSYMFYFCYNLTVLDLSSFDTLNVTNMTYMFYYLYKLNTLKFNNASFNHSPTASFPFYYVPSSVYIIVKDDDARNWIQEKLGSGKGTIVTVAELS